MDDLDKEFFDPVNGDEFDRDEVPGSDPEEANDRAVYCGCCSTCTVEG